MNYNNKFNPNIWDTQRPVHPNAPFSNNPQNFYQNQPNYNFQQGPLFNQNFHQNQNQIRSLLSMPVQHSEHPQPLFRKTKTNNSNINQDYRRPGPACSRNNSNFGNNNFRWKQDNNRRDKFNSRQNESFDGHANNNNNRSMGNEINISSQSQPEVIEPPRRSLVEELKAAQNSKKSDIDAIVTKNASEASKKFLTQLKTMDKDGVKDLINNPKQQHKKKVINIQAREKLREQMRQKLKKLGNDGSDSGEFQVEPDECIDYSNLPETLIAQIGKTIDMNLDADEMDLSESNNEDSIVDKDIEVVTQNLGNDFLMGSEMLLMNGFSLLAETEHEEDSPPLPRLPPLPTEKIEKPPSPPPEHLPPLPVPPPSDKSAVYSSIEKPWTVQPALPCSSFNRDRRDDEWDIESSKNPDPPSLTSFESQYKNISKHATTNQEPPFSSSAPAVHSIVTENLAVPSSVIEKPSIPSLVSEKPAIPSLVTEKIAAVETIVSDDEWDKALSSDKTFGRTPSEDQNKPAERAPEGQRANETYGEYRRRLASDRELSKDKDGDDATNSKEMQPDFNRSNKIQSHQNRFGQGGPVQREDNRNRKNQNDSSWNQHRKSRFDTAWDGNHNKFQKRNSSRDTSASHDSGRIDEVKDVHNYRFQSEKTHEPSIDRLNSLLNPKPVQFKGSFNKKTNNFINHDQRSRSRNRTPNNNSIEREFDPNLLPSPNDIRPCLTTLKRVMDIDAEMAKIHEKIHDVDKVIAKFQSERIGHQKMFSKLQHDRKMLFDNLWKRATTNVDKTDLHRQEEKSVPKVSSQGTSQRAHIEKKLQCIVDKKRKPDEPQEEPIKKKPLFEPMETTSAAEKAAIVQKARDQKAQKNEKKRVKALRREREEAERYRLEEKIRQESMAATKIKVEPSSRDKSVDKTKSSKQQYPEKSHIKSEKPKEPKKIFIQVSETIEFNNSSLLKTSVKLSKKVHLAQDLIDTFKSSGSIEIDVLDWNKWLNPLKIKEPVMTELEIPQKHQFPEVLKDPLALPDSNVDPLAMDENDAMDEGPPTPGSSFTTNEDSMLVEVSTEQDYSEWTGSFSSHEQPIVHLQNINGKFMVCATEGGKVLKYQLSNGKLAAVFSKHTEICNSFLFDNKGSIYTVSTDGYLHKIKFKNFQLVASENFNEALQVIEHSKAGIYVGTKSGRIFRLKNDLTEREEEPICNCDGLILCMKAAKEGSRNILLVSSRTNAIQVRDASDGLLLRILSEDLTGISIYDMLIVGSTIYCGTNRSEIFALDFHTGALKKSRPCGAGVICVKLCKNHLIAACYDGNIYIFNTTNDDDAVKICGPSNMLLAMDIWDDKIIASTKDKTIKIMNIPK